MQEHETRPVGARKGIATGDGRGLMAIQESGANDVEAG